MQEVLIRIGARPALAGKAFTLSDRGALATKGADDAVRPYEVRGRG